MSNAYDFMSSVCIFLGVHEWVHACMRMCIYV